MFLKIRELHLHSSIQEYTFENWNILVNLSSPSLLKQIYLGQVHFIHFIRYMAPNSEELLH